MSLPLAARYARFMSKADAWFESLVSKDQYLYVMCLTILSEKHLHRDDPEWAPTVREMIAQTEAHLKAEGRTPLGKYQGLGAISSLVFHGKIRFVEATPELDDLRHTPITSPKAWLLIWRFSRRCLDLRIVATADLAEHTASANA